MGVDVNEPWAHDMPFCINFSVCSATVKTADLSNQSVLDHDIGPHASLPGPVNYCSATNNQTAHRCPLASPGTPPLTMPR